MLPDLVLVPYFVGISNMPCVVSFESVECYSLRSARASPKVLPALLSNPDPYP